MTCKECGKTVFTQGGFYGLHVECAARIIDRHFAAKARRKENEKPTPGLTPRREQA